MEVNNFFDFMIRLIVARTEHATAVRSVNKLVPTVKKVKQRSGKAIGIPSLVVFNYVHLLRISM